MEVGYIENHRLRVLEKGALMRCHIPIKPFIEVMVTQNGCYV